MQHTPQDDQELISTKEASAILNISQVHVARLCKTGKLPAQFVGRYWIMKRGDVERLREERKE